MIVAGSAAPEARVAVVFPASGGVTYPVFRQGGNFYKQLTVENGAAAQHVSFEVVGVKNGATMQELDKVAALQKTVFVPKTPEAFTYDEDGNLTGDGRWQYSWEGENRLSSMQTSAEASSAGVTNQRLEFIYDSMNRRIAKKVYNWDVVLGNWTIAGDYRFLYDGWNLLAEFAVLPASSAPNGGNVVRSYVWGADSSGTLDGAAGIGGLLFAISSSVKYGVVKGPDDKLIVWHWSGTNNASIILREMEDPRAQAIRGGKPPAKP